MVYELIITAGIYYRSEVVPEPHLNLILLRKSSARTRPLLLYITYPSSPIVSFNTRTKKDIATKDGGRNNKVRTQRDQSDQDMPCLQAFARPAESMRMCEAVQ